MRGPHNVRKLQEKLTSRLLSTRRFHQYSEPIDSILGQISKSMNEDAGAAPPPARHMDRRSSRLYGACWLSVVEIASMKSHGER
jgi:hypothetical protein